MKSKLDELAKRVEGLKTHNYNRTKKACCEYCGALEGWYHKDGCEAMEEAYNNKALDKVLSEIRKLKDEK